MNAGADSGPGTVERTVPGTNQQQTESELILGLLRAVHRDEKLTQRSAARELGVALGLVNTYLKRCVKKGLIKVKHAPASRYMYYLTPQGFAEKGRLTAEFLSQSLNLFRQAQNEYQDILTICAKNGWGRIALCGASELAEIMVLYSREHSVEIVGVIDAGARKADFPNLPLYKTRRTLGDIDAFVITALKNAQEVYDTVIDDVPPENVLVPGLLEIDIHPDSYEGGK